MMRLTMPDDGIPSVVFTSSFRWSYLRRGGALVSVSRTITRPNLRGSELRAAHSGSTGTNAFSGWCALEPAEAWSSQPSTM